MTAANGPGPPGDAPGWLGNQPPVPAQCAASQRGCTETDVCVFDRARGMVGS